jgi:hypothetical protein
LICKGELSTQARLPLENGLRMGQGVRSATKTLRLPLVESMRERCERGELRAPHRLGLADGEVGPGE